MAARGVSGKRMIVGGGIIGVVVVGVIVGAFLAVGREPLVRESRTSEARARAAAMASAIALCTDGKDALPESGAPGLACTSYEATAVGFTFAWERRNEHEGVLVATSADGPRIEVPVTCDPATKRCTRGILHQAH